MIDITGVWDNIKSWIDPELLTINTTVQLGVFLIAWGLGRMAARPVKAHFYAKLATQAGMSYRLMEVCRGLIALISPLFTFLILFFGARMLMAAAFDFNTAFLTVTSKLLLAWVFVRLSTLFILSRAGRTIFTVLIYGIAALSIFGVLDNITASLSMIGFSLGEFQISALGVVKGLMALFFMIYAAMAVVTFIDGRLEKAGINGASRILIAKILRIFFIASAFLISITTAGVDLSVLAVFSGAVGIGIGFGLQRGAANLFSGMMLLMDQSLKPGDIIEVPDPSGQGTAFGWIKNMGSRYIEIITRDNKSFYIPNEQLISQQVVNWSHNDTLVRLETEFRVHYDSDPHLVRKIACEAALTANRVEKDPTPACHLIEFGDSAIRFTLRFWIRDAENGITNVRGDVMLALWDTFQKHGIKIPYSQHDIYIHKEA